MTDAAFFHLSVVVPIDVAVCNEAELIVQSTESSLEQRLGQLVVVAEVVLAATVRQQA